MYATVNYVAFYDRQTKKQILNVSNSAGMRTVTFSNTIEKSLVACGGDNAHLKIIDRRNFYAVLRILCCQHHQNFRYGLKCFQNSSTVCEFCANAITFNTINTYYYIIVLLFIFWNTLQITYLAWLDLSSVPFVLPNTVSGEIFIKYQASRFMLERCRSNPLVGVWASYTDREGIKVVQRMKQDSRKSFY